MPDLYDMRNNLDKAYEVIAKVRRDRGQPPPDEVSFVEGFFCCFGIITRRVDIGIGEDVPTDRILDNLHRDLMDFGRRVADNQAMQDGVREGINGFEN